MSQNASVVACALVVFSTFGLMHVTSGMRTTVTLDLRCYTRNDDSVPDYRTITIDKEFGGILRLETMKGVCIPAGVIPNDGRQ